MYIAARCSRRVRLSVLLLTGTRDPVLIAIAFMGVMAIGGGAMFGPQPRIALRFSARYDLFTGASREPDIVQGGKAQRIPPSYSLE